MMNPGSESKPGGMGVFKYELLLLLTSIIWGAAFVAQQIAMERGLGPMTFTGLRFALEGLAKGPAFSSRLMAVVLAAAVPPCPPNRDSLTFSDFRARPRFQFRISGETARIQSQLPQSDYADSQIQTSARL